MSKGKIIEMSKLSRHKSVKQRTAIELAQEYYIEPAVDYVLAKTTGLVMKILKEVRDANVAADPEEVKNKMKKAVDDFLEEIDEFVDRKKK